MIKVLYLLCRFSPIVSSPVIIATYLTGHNDDCSGWLHSHSATCLFLVKCPPNLLETNKPDTPCSKLDHNVSPTSRKGPWGMLLISAVQASCYCVPGSSVEKEVTGMAIFYLTFCIYCCTVMGNSTFHDVLLETIRASMPKFTVGC